MFSEPDRPTRAARSARADIARVRAWAADKTLHELQTGVLVRYAIERAFMTIDAALRDIPAELLARHHVENRLVADFRNVLAHAYEDVLDARVINTIHRDLPMLSDQLAAILTDLAAG